MEFKTSTREGLVDFNNVYDLEKMAQEIIPKGAFGYIASGAGDLFTLYENTRAFNHQLVLPKTLRGFDKPDTSTEIYGDQLTSPIIMAPIASHKLVNEAGEIASAKATKEFGSIYTVSSYSSTDLPAIGEALEGSPLWFQFYFSKDNEINKKIMDRVKEQGAKAIVLTADATVAGNREVDKRNHFTVPFGMPTVAGNREVDKRNHFTFPFGMPIVDEFLHSDGHQTIGSVYQSAKQDLSPEDVAFIKEYSGLPVYVKGDSICRRCAICIGWRPRLI